MSNPFSIPADHNGVRRTISLFVLIFSGMGVRLFSTIPGRIFIFAIILYFLNYREVKRLKPDIWGKFIIIVLLYFLFNIIKGTEPFYPMIIGWLSALFTLSPYINGCDRFVADLYRLTNFCVIYSLLHVILQLLFSPFIIKTGIPMEPKTFLYLFYYNRLQVWGGLNRIQGFCWEPSNWNLLLNMNLVIALTYKDSYKKILLNVLAIITVMSTTGIVVMFCVMIIYYLFYYSRSKLLRLLVTVVLFISFGGIVNEVLTSKLSNASGNARFADFFVAYVVAKESPLFGADVDNISRNPIASIAREEAWEGEGPIDQGLMEREGMVNSFAQLTIEWGIPLTILFLWLLFKCPLFYENKTRYLFMIMILMVLMGTPISRTGFFCMFIMSSVFIHRRDDGYIKVPRPLLKNNKNNPRKIESKQI